MPKYRDGLYALANYAAWMSDLASWTRLAAVAGCWCLCRSERAARDRKKSRRDCRKRRASRDARTNFGHAGLASRCCMQAVCHGDALRPNSSSLAASFQTEEVEGDTDMSLRGVQLCTNVQRRADRRCYGCQTDRLTALTIVAQQLIVILDSSSTIGIRRPSITRTLPLVANRSFAVLRCLPRCSARRLAPPQKSSNRARHQHSSPESSRTLHQLVVDAMPPRASEQQP